MRPFDGVTMNETPNSALRNNTISLTEGSHNSMNSIEVMKNFNGMRNKIGLGDTIENAYGIPQAPTLAQESISNKIMP